MFIKLHTACSALKGWLGNPGFGLVALFLPTNASPVCVACFGLALPVREIPRIRITLLFLQGSHAFLIAAPANKSITIIIPPGASFLTHFTYKNSAVRGNIQDISVSVM